MFFVQVFSASPQPPHIARDTISKEIIQSENKWQFSFKPEKKRRKKKDY